MRTTTAQGVCRVLAILSLVAAGLWSPSLASAGSGPRPVAATSPGAPAPQSYAGPCTDDLGVTVVVDFQGLGGSTVVRCAPGSGGAPFQGSGLAAFQAAGIQLGGTSQHGLSVICRVNGRPAADEPLPIPGDEDYTEQCTTMPPAAAFWSYWQADNGGSWTFSQRGVSSSTARAGGFEALSFSLNSSSAPPRTAPSRPVPEPPPTQDPAPTPAPEPEPTPPPSQDPTPVPPPTPPPSPEQPSSPSPQPPTGPAPSSGPGQPTPGQPTPEQPTPSDAAPNPAPTSDRTSAPGDAETTTSAGEGDAGATTGGPAAGDDTDVTSGPAGPDDPATADDSATSGSPTDAASGPFTSDPAEDGGGAGALWVTVGILLLLGVLAFLASRRRGDPGITHQVEP